MYFEEAQLRQLYDLNIPAEDINLIVDTMQRRGQSHGVARDDTHGGLALGQHAERRRNTMSREDRCS
jgi:hypothetical protein